MGGCNAPDESKETFKVLDAGNSRIALKAGKGVCTSKGGQEKPCALEDIPEQSKFEVITRGEGKLALKGANGKYCSDTAQGIQCKAESITAKEEFVFTTRDNNQGAQT